MGKSSGCEDPFRKGAEVEVSFEEEGFRGSWYSATVIRPVSPKTDKIFLEFHGLMANDSGHRKLREHVDVVLVRPIPPREQPSARAFSLSDEVDAFHNDGWWEGIVTAVLPGARYSVFFRSSREQIDFDQSDLRLHREWVHGEWVPPFEDQKPPPPPPPPPPSSSTAAPTRRLTRRR